MKNWGKCESPEKKGSKKQETEKKTRNREKNKSP